MSIVSDNQIRFKKRKNHFDLISRTQIYMNKKTIEDRIQEVQHFCKRLGLEIVNVTIMKCETEGFITKPEIHYIGRINNFEKIKRKKLRKL